MKKRDQSCLYLTLKQTQFDEILDGSRSITEREIKYTTYKKYLELDDKGALLYDQAKIKSTNPLCQDIYVFNNGNYPYRPNKQIKYLSLNVGCQKNRDKALVEVTSITFEPYLFNNRPCRFKEEGMTGAVMDDEGDLCFWKIVFHLGKILECDRHSR